MKYAPVEYALKFRERSSAFGAEPDLVLLAEATEAALRLRGWQDPATQQTVAKWQSVHGGLTANGQYDALSASALAEDLNKPSPPPFFDPTRSESAAPAYDATPPRASASPSRVPVAARPAPAPPTLAVTHARKAQALLMTKGWKDSATKAALRDWQAAHGGLVADGQYNAPSAAALADDLGGPSPSPFYTPGASAAHPELVAAVDENSRLKLQQLADRATALAAPQPSPGMSQGSSHALTFGVGALAVGTAAFLMIRKPRSPAGGSR